MTIFFNESMNYLARIPPTSALVVDGVLAGVSVTGGSKRRKFVESICNNDELYIY